MNLNEELKNLPELEPIGLALAAYAAALSPGLRLVRNANGRYVSEPENFVTFTAHWKRAKNITVTIRGNASEFAQLAELPLGDDQNGYSVFKITSASQLAAAAWYIRHAHELFLRGRFRKQKKQQVLEA